jgi:hypothetical protein
MKQIVWAWLDLLNIGGSGSSNLLLGWIRIHAKVLDVDQVNCATFCQ